MGREVRRVPPDWKHPTTDGGRFIPLFDGADYEKRVARWDEEAAKWAEGLRDDFSGGWVPVDPEWLGKPFAAWYGERPRSEDYMPTWPPDVATHLMMYENTSEGAPISPAFATPEELARWLADNNASAFGYMGADYDHWLVVCRGRPSVGMVVANGVIMSGVQAST